MITKLKTAKAGFTLVEIMIVVAILALLASIALPNFLRAKKRAQAVMVLEEIQLIEKAKQLYATENSLQGSASMAWSGVQKHIKPGTRLANVSLTLPVDLMNNSIALGIVEVPPKISDTTRDEFAAVLVDPEAFWGSYAN
jgi:prepilin-type N-terminal cleavage/methylation domain-containing protein